MGARTFVLIDGVWTDTGFDPQAMQTVKIGFLSEDYFALAASRTELGAAFALGSRVIALSDGVAYEVVEDASTVTTPVEIPPTRTPEPSEAASPRRYPLRRKRRGRPRWNPRKSLPAPQPPGGALFPPAEPV